MVNYFGDLKLGDFGACITFEDENSKFFEFIGTSGYMAPELVEQKCSPAKMRSYGLEKRFTDGYSRLIHIFFIWVTIIIFTLSLIEPTVHLRD